MTDEEQGCGWSYDHTLDVIDETDDEVAYECRECGAELVVDRA